MPRSAGIYTKPFPDVVEGTTIESAVHNGTISDIEVDLNTPRPIIAGGTGANNAHDALVNLHGEETFQTVTNYDTFPFVAGSFYSVAGATAAPTPGAYYAGICYVYGDTNYVTIEARDVHTGVLWLRQKVGGVWQGWTEQAPSLGNLDARYVNVTGDTMSGDLYITMPNFPSVHFTNSDPGKHYQLFLGYGTMYMRDVGAALECFNCDALNFNIPNGQLTVKSTITGNSDIRTKTNGSPNNGTVYFGDVGYLTYQGGGFGFSHPVNVGGILSASGSIRAGNAASSGVLYLGNGDTYLRFDGTQFNMIGGGLTTNSYLMCNGQVRSRETADSGTYYFGDATVAYLNYSGGAFSFRGGPVSLEQGEGLPQLTFRNSASGHVRRFRLNTGNLALLNNAYTADVQTFFDDGTISCQGHLIAVGQVNANGFICRAGMGGGAPGYNFNYYWTGSSMQGWVDTTNVGNVSGLSDYRIKKDVIDLPGMWDTVKALRPIKYTQAEFSPPSHVKHVADELAKSRKEAEEYPEIAPKEVATGPMFEADDVERWGFLAHELQETLTPSASTGVKDSPDTIQAPNPWTVIATLTKALQEAMARIEALEAA